MGKTREYTFRADKYNVTEVLFAEIIGALTAITNPKFKNYGFAGNETEFSYEITIETTSKLFRKALRYCINAYPNMVYVKL